MSERPIETHPLVDGRDTVGPWRHETADQMEEGWRLWVEGGVRDGRIWLANGLPVRRRAGDTSVDLRETGETIAAGVEAGRWTSRCPHCNDGVRLLPVHPRGCCLGCGRIYLVDWPPGDEIAEAVELLAARPVEQRNWHRFAEGGETVEYLRRENAAYKFSPRDDAESRVVRADALREILSPREFAKLQKAGVV